MLNFTAMLEYGYVRDSVECCYQEISRPEAGSTQFPDSTAR